MTFISGAGLLLLFPTFFKEEILVLLRIFLERSGDVFFILGANRLGLAVLMFALVIYPFVLSLTIPIYGLFLLLKDIVHFYFTIRYIKTLLMFVWTTVVAFVMLPFLNDARLPTFLLIAIGYSLWSLLAMPIMHIPINWIYRHKKETWDKTHLDPQLMRFESQMRPFVYGACVSSLIAAVLSALVCFD